MGVMIEGDFDFVDGRLFDKLKVFGFCFFGFFCIDFDIWLDIESNEVFVEYF